MEALYSPTLLKPKYWALGLDYSLPAGGLISVSHCTALKLTVGEAAEQDAGITMPIHSTQIVRMDGLMLAASVESSEVICILTAQSSEQQWLSSEG